MNTSLLPSFLDSSLLFPASLNTHNIFQASSCLWPVSLYQPPMTPLEVDLWSATHLHSLANATRIARKILPRARRQNDLLHDGYFSVALRSRYSQEANRTLGRGGWIVPSAGIYGENVVELYAHIHGCTYNAAVLALANEAELASPGGEVCANMQLGSWQQEQHPLCPPLELPYPSLNYPYGSDRLLYYNLSGHPILEAIRWQGVKAETVCVYRSLWRHRSSTHCQWAEIIPQKPYPIFNSNMLLSAPDCPVFLVKDEFMAYELSQARSECRFIAVPGGLKGLSNADLRLLKGRQVTVILSSNDLKEGHRVYHALQAAGLINSRFSLDHRAMSRPFELLEEAAAQVGIALLPPPPEEKLMHRSGVVIAEGEPIPEGDKTRRMLISPVICEGYLVWLFAEPKIGKTWLALALALAAARGNRTVGRWHTADPVGVLYVDGEMLPDELQQCISMVMAGTGELPGPAPFATICAHCQDDGVVDITSEEWQVTIEKALIGKQLLILDNFQSLTDNGQGALNFLRSWLRRLTRKGVAVIVLDHTNRDGDLQGSISKERISNLLIALRYPDEQAKEEGRIIVEYPKARRLHGVDAEPFQLQKRFTNSTFAFEVVPDRSADLTNVRPQVLKIALVAFAKDVEGVSYPKIQERYGIPPSTAHGYYQDAGKLTGDERAAYDKERQRLIIERGSSSST